ARRVGRVPHDTVAQGPAAIAAALAALAAEGAGHALLDAVTEAQLLDIGRALRDVPLAAGGAGLGHAWAVALAPQSGGPAPALPAVGGRAVVLAGSCSEATRRQIDAVRGRWPCATLDADALIADAEAEVARLAAWVSAQPAAAAVLVAASLPPADLRRVQARHGAREAAAAVEAGFRQLASRLLEQGVRRFIVAGGETSGAVVEAVTACTGGQVLRIGPEVAPGVPQTVLLGTSPVGLVLKSGNFGGADFFMQALGFTPDG
ncbi:MAG: nucleotide-binding domain containing protein, partial [Betaproteobacteria bacterium]